MKRRIAHSYPYIPIKVYWDYVKLLRHREITIGHHNEEFNRLIYEFFGTDSSFITTRSGKDALKIALLHVCAGTSKQSNIVIPTYVCKEVLEAVTELGYTPNIVDVDSSGFIDVQEVKKKINGDTKAIIACQLFGQIHNLDGILSLKIPVIEDSCQNFDLSNLRATYRVYSFGPTKMLTFMRGGAVLLKNSNEELLIRAKTNEINELVFEFNQFEYALAVAQLKKIQSNLSKRLKIANRYKVAGFEQFESENMLFNQHYRHILRCNVEFKTAQNYFQRNKIEIRRGVDSLLHWKYSYPDTDFPNAISLFNESISLPIYPNLTLLQQYRIIRSLKKFVAEQSK